MTQHTEHTETASQERVSHTPGPWKVRHGNKDYCYVDAPDHRIICEWEDFNDGKANARLIAAAPELLEALTTLVDTVVSSGDPEEVEWFFRAPVKAAHVAITKATE